MVNLFPKDLEQLENKEVPPSEQDVYKLFESLNNDWFIWHSVEWMEKKVTKPLLLGESDFLVFNPNYGFLILEVKGGAIRRKLDMVNAHPYRTVDRQILEDYEGEWSREYFNHKGILIENKILKNNPFEQARKSMFFFLRFYIAYIKSLKGRIDDSIYDKLLLPHDNFPGNFNCGVVLPDCNFKEKNISPIREFVKEMIFDGTDVKAQQEWGKDVPRKRSPESPIEQYLKHLYRMFSKRTPPTELKNIFINMIEYKIETNLVLNSWIENQQYILEKINKVQDFALDLLEEKKRCLFRGSAGTGKTFIAMKKIIREYKNKHKTLFLCFNRKLHEFVEEYINTQNLIDLRKKLADIRISTIDRLFYSIAKRHLQNDKFDFYLEKFDQGEFDEISKVIKKILINQEGDTYKYDSIIVDEGQDIRNEYWPIIRLLLKDEGNSTFYVFYDQSQLKFNKMFDPINTGLDLNSDKFILTKNLRNADEIIRWIKKETNLGDYKEFLGLSSIEHDFRLEHSEKLRDVLKSAMLKIYNLHTRSLINPDRFTVLCDKILDFLPRVSYRLKEEKYNKINYSTIRYDMRDKTTKKMEYYYLIQTNKLEDLKKLREIYLDRIFISFNGIGSFKGLENDIIILIVKKPDRIDKEKFDTYLKDIYIGASRAKFLLYLYTYSEV